MATLNLYIVKNELAPGVFVTRTCIGKKKGAEKIVFHNQSDGELRIDFNPGNVIKEGRSIVVPKKDANGKVNKAEVNFVDGAAEWTAVKYTATIDGAASEDPIIMVD